MRLKFLFFISLLILSSFKAKADNFCDFSSIYFTDEMMDFKNIQSIEIKANKQKQWVVNAISALYEQQNIKKERKKKFTSQIEVTYPFGKCVLNGKIRLHGDWKDTHISWENNILRTSLDVEILDSNISGITQFKLFLPEARNSYTEVISSEILRKLGFLSPRTKIINSNINGYDYDVIFQEKIVKEFLENNNLREGAILEGDESLMFQGSDGDNSLNSILLSRIVNTNWSKKSYENLFSSIKALDALQGAYIAKSNLDLNEYIDWRKVINTLPKNEDYLKYIQKNETLWIALGGTHSLYASNRKFYFDQLTEKLYPIYYDSGPDLNEKCLFLNCSKNQREFYSEFLTSEIIKESKKDFLDILKDDEFTSKLLSNLKIPENIFNEYVEFIKKRFSEFENIEFNSGSLNNSEYKIEDYKNKVFKLNDKIKFLYLNEIDWSNQVVNYDICNFKNCEKNLIMNLNDIYDIFNRESLIFPNVFYIKSSVKDLFNYKTKIFDQGNIKVLYNKNSSTPFFDTDNKTLIFDQINSKDQYVIINSILKNITIEFKGAEINKSSQENINFFNQTGCLNIIDSIIDNTKIYSENGHCEDSVNIIRTKGEINIIDIKNAFSDAIDFDFSKVNVENLNIDYANNDCSDFSGGVYGIQNLNLSECGDKALSIGEYSKVRVFDMFAMKSNIGIAVKDSSVLNIENLSLNIMQYCLAAYNKKNEFNGGLINLGSVICENYSDFYDTDKQSIIIPEEKLTKEKLINISNQNYNLVDDFPTFSTKKNINGIVEVPKGTKEIWSIDKINGVINHEYYMGQKIFTDIEFPFNFGFIPRTSVPIKLGGSGEPLDIFIIGKKEIRGQLVEAKIIGGIKILDTGETDYKIISVEKNQKNLSQEEIEKIKISLKIFLEEYKNKNTIKFQKFLTEDEALELIKTSNDQFKKSGIRIR